MGLAILVFVLVVFFDQITKFLVYGTIARSVIGDFLWFQSTLNTGVAFSMFEGANIALSVVTGAACIVLLYFIFSKKVFKPITEKIALSLIFGGTFSNFIDRLALGGVRDFIYLKFIDYAIFNVADVAVVCGVIILCISVVIRMVREIRSEKRVQETAGDKNE